MPSLSWLRPLSLLCMAFVINVALAAPRVFPVDTYQVQLQAYSEPYVVVDSTTLMLSPGVLIYTKSNETLVKGMMPVGAYVRIELDPQNNIRRIWILKDDELVPLSIWTQIFGTTFVPPTRGP